MKTIIILILALTCKFANGQMNQKAETFLDTVYYQIHDMGMDADSFTHKQYVDAKILKFLVSEYDEYSKECYADSTLKIDTSCPDNIPGCDVLHRREYYYHKQPDFTGFMKWLQNKVK